MRPTSRLLPIRERGHVGRGYDACEAAGGALAPSVEPNQSWDVSTCSFYSSSVPSNADGTVDLFSARGLPPGVRGVGGVVEAGRGLAARTEYPAGVSTTRDDDDGAAIGRSDLGD